MRRRGEGRLWCDLKEGSPSPPLTPLWCQCWFVCARFQRAGPYLHHCTARLSLPSQRSSIASSLCCVLPSAALALEPMHGSGRFRARWRQGRVDLLSTSAWQAQQQKSCRPAQAQQRSNDWVERVRLFLAGANASFSPKGSRDQHENRETLKRR